MFHLDDTAVTAGPFYDTELQMIKKFSESGGHRNIVPILRHGWIRENSTYFLDMECCPMTLDTFICHQFSSALGISHFLPLTTNFPSILPPVFSLWSIMRDITSGLKFIHLLNTIHRDIKPKNGAFKSY